jgi:hypothetical protein
MLDVNDSSCAERAGALSGAIFLFGLSALFASNTIWPGILILFWLTSIPAVIAGTGWKMGLWTTAQTALWLFGLAALFASNTIWPGVLVLAGMSALLVAIVPPSKLTASPLKAQSGAKRKRRMPLPQHMEHPADDEEENELDEELIAAQPDDQDYRQSDRKSGG